MTRSGRCRSLWPILLVACLLSLLALPAAAQRSSTEAPRARLTVTSLTTALGSGSLPATDDPLAARTAPDHLDARVLVENVGATPLDTVQLVVEVHPPVQDRASLTAAFEGELEGEATHVHTREVAGGSRIASDEIRGVDTSFGVDELGWTGEPAGVHPVRFTLMRGTEVLDELVTAVVWLPERLDSPLATTLVWPFNAPIWRSVGGSYPPGVDRELERGGRLDTLLSSVQDTSAPVVLAPAAHLLEDLSSRADGYEVAEVGPQGTVSRTDVPARDPSAALATATLRRFRELAARATHPPVTGAYADADLAALLDGSAPLRDLAATTAADGRRRVRIHTGTPLDAAIYPVGGRIDEAVLDVLPGDLLLLGSDVVTTADGQLTSEPVRRLTAPSGRLMTGIVADPAAEAALAALEFDPDTVTAVQRVLAEAAAAIVLDEDPSTASMLLLPPARFDPSPAAAHLLLTALQEATWVELGAPNSLVREHVNRAATGLSPAPVSFDERYSRALETALASLEAATASSADEAGRIGGRAVDDLRDDLMRSTSRWYDETASDDAIGLVDDVDRHLEAAFGGVSVTSGSVTLTSDAGQIPITLRRTRGETIRVQVTLESPGGLRWPEGRVSEVIQLEPEASRTVTFPVQALSTGTFPVSVRITDPEGTQEITRESISVRSTAFSGGALVGIAVVVVALLLYGALRRRGRPPEAELRLVPTGSAPDPPHRSP